MARSWLPLLVWSGALVVALAMWITLESMQQVPSSESAIAIVRMERIAVHAPSPASLPREGWQAVDLPDDWLNRGTPGTEIWYRAVLDLNVPPNRLWAVLLPGVNLAVAAYLNGELVGSSLNLEEPLSQDWNRPLMFSIPNGILRPGSNLVQLRVRSYPSGHGFLAPLYLGPNELLLPSFESRRFLQVDLSRFITTGSFFMSLFIALIWWMKRTESVYGWLALATFFWAVHSLKYHVSDIPVSSFHWAALLFVSAIGFCSAMVLFMHRFTKQKLPFMERLVLGQALIGSLVIILLTIARTDLMYNVAQVFVSLSILITAYSFVRMVIRIWNGRSLERYLVGAASLVVMVLGVRDWVLILGFMERPAGQLTQYAIPLLLGVLGIVLVNRFVHALRVSEETTETLEQRVQEKSSELEANYRHLQRLERERVLAAERERLMRDMHDGVGGHLISSLALLRSRGIDDGELEAALNVALTDLRLMIDSLDSVDDDLNSVLGMFRDRMQRILEASGISARWHIDRLPEFPDLGPDRVLQILRILQEALTNVIRHAGATAVEISATHDEALNRTRIVVRDDGRGMGSGRSGRGLLNMNSRAAKLGAELSITSGEEGTSVSLDLPHPGSWDN